VGEQILKFTDNSPEAITQRRLITLIRGQELQQGPQNEHVLQGKFGPIQKKENNTGLPDNLKSGIENLSGIDISDVGVHYNSEKPSQLQAHAYAQGTDIHVAPGQEQRLPHEAWHVVQQKQGRVKPTLQLKSGVYVNDDTGLEREADVMGTKATAEVSHKVPLNKPASGSHSKNLVQRVSKVFVGKSEVKEGHKHREKIFLGAEEFTGNFSGEIWFNSWGEFNQWTANKGKVEGLGVWAGRWMNFTNKRPIVLGEEEHNDQKRTEFLKQLNIARVVVEAVSERSLAGVDSKGIPLHSTKSTIHQKYSGNGRGNALENYWTRSAQTMAKFWIKFEEGLDNFDPASRWTKIPQISEYEDEFDELVTTIEHITVGSMDEKGRDGESKSAKTKKEGIEENINQELGRAKAHLEESKAAGLRKIISLDAHSASNLQEVLKGVSVRAVHSAFVKFRKSVETIGNLNFRAGATEEELELDELTKNNKDPFKVWAGRREHFMLKNLEHALAQSPPPLIITMGSVHATNQRGKIEELLNSRKGMLVMGSIADLANIGAVKMYEVAEDISETLAMMYGWNDSDTKKFSESKEALDLAKIRVGNTRKSAPSYIS
jgi:hypothetical protein